MMKKILLTVLILFLSFSIASKADSGASALAISSASLVISAANMGDIEEIKQQIRLSDKQTQEALTILKNKNYTPDLLYSDYKKFINYRSNYSWVGWMLFIITAFLLALLLIRWIRN